MTFMIVPAASGDRNRFLTQAAVLPPACSVLVEDLLPGVVLGNGMGDHQRRHLSCSPPVILFSYRKKIYQEAAVDASAEEHEFLDPEEYETWNALLSLSQGTLHALDVELQSSARLSVTEFDVLITLFNAEDRRLGMSSLAQSAMLSPSGLTHLVTRLERHGLVDRVVDPADGRKFFAVLTDAGDARLRQARPIHNRVLRSLLFTHMGAADRRCLARIWARVAQTSEG